MLFRSWAIGSGEEYSDPEYQDQVESQALYNILEHEVVPLYYDRQSDGLPRGWIAKMKNSMKKLCPIFNTNRMVAEYAERFYLPAASRYAKLTAKGAQKAKRLVEWRSRVWPEWKEVGVEQVESHHVDGITVGAVLAVKARVRLGPLSPNDVSVQIYQGLLDSNRQFQEGAPIVMKLRKSLGNGMHSYQGEIPCQQSGLCGFSVRILPHHEDAILPYELPLAAWEEGTE